MDDTTIPATPVAVEESTEATVAPVTEATSEEVAPVTADGTETELVAPVVII